MNQDKSKKLVGLLLEKIPEIGAYCGTDWLESAYLMYDCLGSFLLECIINNADNELIKRIYQFINTLCENEDNDATTILGVTFLESLASSKQTHSVSGNYLKGKALVFLKR